jgi:hypothetical protein
MWSYSSPASRVHYTLSFSIKVIILRRMVLSAGFYVSPNYPGALRHS